jgi:hypothetical protein
MEEIWKPMYHYTYYFISNYGNAKKIKEDKEIELKGELYRYKVYFEKRWHSVPIELTIHDLFSSEEIPKKEVVNLEGEIWKDVPNYKFYQASNKGRIKTLQRVINRRRSRFFQKEEIIGECTNTGLYKQLSICTENGYKTIPVHRFVCLAFHENPNNYPHINHKDGNKFNNYEDNLEWCTPSQNQKHAYDLGLRKHVTHIKNKCPYCDQLIADFWLNKHFKHKHDRY